MNAKNFWNIFLETGAPEMYLLYTQALKREEPDVSEDPWPGTAGHGLQ